MAVVVWMEWPEVSEEQYEQMRDEVGWEQDVPEGVIFHVASFTPDGFRVFDLWESPEHFQRFIDERVAPVVKALGVESQPAVTIAPAHRVFAPNVPGGGRAAARKAKPRRAKAAKRARKTAATRGSKRAAKRGARRATRRRAK
jgi:hypothetical protein